MDKIQQTIKDLLDEGFTLDQIESAIQALTIQDEEEGES